MPIGAAIGGAAIGGIGSAVAGGEQASGAEAAANTSAQASQQATAAQLQMYNQTRSDLQPYTQAGYSALPQLQSLLGPTGQINSTLGQLSNLYGTNGPLSQLLGTSPGGSAAAQSALAQTPGYQFAQSQGQQSLDRSAASRGMLLSGGQLKDSQAYGQGLATQTYQNAISNLQGYGSSLGGLASQYGTYGNEIAGLVNTGENAGAQTGNAGSAAATGISNSLLTGAGQQSSALQNAATANASGVAGATNNIGTLLNNSSLQALFQSDPSVPSTDLGNLGYTDIGTPQLSDRRAKTDIKKIGKAESGLNIYSYRLKGDNRTQIGVMADEVKTVAPHAVTRAADGYDRVDYAAISKLPPRKKAA